MAGNWKSTKYPGVRYREHPTRKHGVRLDRYFSIRYRHDGKRREEGLGWTSEGMTAEKAAGYLSRLKEAQRTGKGPKSLKESREIEAERQKAEIIAKGKARIGSLLFGEVFRVHYLPHAKQNKKPRSWKAEDSLFRHWIEPVIGNIPLKEISPFHIERIKKAMADKGRTPRSTEYAMATVRQVFNFANIRGLFEGISPTTKVKVPSADNRRVRFLTESEANALLKGLALKSTQVYEMAVVSLDGGLRAGEVFGLTWADVDFERSLLVLRDTKSNKTRFVPMTSRIREVLSAKQGGKPSELVFPSKNGDRITQISQAFYITVKNLGLNEGVADPRQKVTFHTLRHTYASWLVERGVDLYMVKELLGHSTVQLTERYSHLRPDTLKRAVQVLEGKPAQERNIYISNGGRD